MHVFSHEIYSSLEMCNKAHLLTACIIFDNRVELQRNRSEIFHHSWVLRIQAKEEVELPFDT